MKKLWCLTILAVVVHAPFCLANLPKPDPFERALFFRILKTEGKQSYYNDFVAYLKKHGLHRVVNNHRIFYQSFFWRNYKMPAFAFPPRKLWPNMLDTLRFLRDVLIPVLGPFRVNSGYRSPAFNKRHNGAKRSRHLYFAALDLMPVRRNSKKRFEKTLALLWKLHGRKFAIGLGVYGHYDYSFHIDSYGYRRWGITTPFRGNL